MSVVDINSRLPHTAGEMICLNCRAGWMGVVPTGVSMCECPDCGSMKGVRKQFVAPEDGVATFRCYKCGDPEELNEVFMITPAFIICCGCGFHHSFEDVFDAKS